MLELPLRIAFMESERVVSDSRQKAPVPGNGIRGINIQGSQLCISKDIGRKAEFLGIAYMSAKDGCANQTNSYDPYHDYLYLSKTSSIAADLSSYVPISARFKVSDELIFPSMTAKISRHSIPASSR